MILNALCSSSCTMSTQLHQFLLIFHVLFFCSFTIFNYHAIYVVVLQWLVIKQSKNSNFVCGNYWNSVPTNPCWSTCDVLACALFHFCNINLLTWLCKSTCVSLLSFLSPPCCMLLSLDITCTIESTAYNITVIIIVPPRPSRVTSICIGLILIWQWKLL